MKKIDTIEELRQLLLDLALEFDKLCRRHSIPYYMVEGTQLGASRHKGFIPWDDDMDFGIPRPYYNHFLKVAEAELPKPYRLLTVYNNKRIFSGFAKIELTNTAISEKHFTNLIGVNIDIFPIDYANTDKGLFSKNKIIKYFNKIQSYRFSPIRNRSIYKQIIALFLKVTLFPLKRNYLIDFTTKYLIEKSGSHYTNHYAAYGMKEIMPISYYGNPTLYEFEDKKLYGVEKPDEYLTSIYGRWQELPPPVNRNTTFWNYITVNRYFLIVIDFLFHIIPMDKNMFFFSSFNGLYNDNPKYISEELHNRYPTKKIIWLIDKRTNSHDIPSYVIQVKPMSIAYLYYKNRSKTLIDNFTGFLGGKHKPKILWQFIFKKRNQDNYSTWHGTPLKKIGKDSVKIKFDYYTTSTAMVFNSDYIIDIMKKAITNKVPMYKLGSPRNDLLFEKNSIKKDSIRQKLNLPKNKKIALFAPTYRSTNNDIDGKGYSIYLSNADVNKCLVSLNKRFGGEWIFINRVHQKVHEIDFKFDNTIVYNGNAHDDMSEYLLLADFLITDYSGSIFDYTITNRPCVLYIPDYEHYKNEGRGLYMEIDKLPYPSARNAEELQVQIESYDMTNVSSKINEFNKLIGMCDDGKAASRIVDVMANV